MRWLIPLVLAWPIATQADEPESGEHVYRETCASCHATKFDKAPQLGDRKEHRLRSGRH